MKLKTRKIKHCLLCKNKSIKKIFSLGNLFVSNFVNKKNIKTGIKAPLNLLYCKNCSLIQLSHMAPQEIMYKRFYWYRSGVTKTMRLGLKNIYEDSLKYVRLKKKDVILDIGANDGTLLHYYRKKKFITIGCEPAKNLQKFLQKSCNFSIKNFWSKQELFKVICDKFSDERKKFNHLMENKNIIEDELQKGAEKAKTIAKEVLNRVRKNIGY